MAERRPSSYSLEMHRRTARATRPRGSPGVAPPRIATTRRRVAEILLGRRETASRAPDCAASPRRAIPIGVKARAESRVQSVALDAVSMAPGSAVLKSAHARQSTVGAPRRRACRTPLDPERARAAGAEPPPIVRRGNQQRRRRSEFYSATSMVAPKASRPTVDLPRRLERMEEPTSFGRHSAPANSAHGRHPPITWDSPGTVGVDIVLMVAA